MIGWMARAEQFIAFSETLQIRYFLAGIYIYTYILSQY